MKKILIIVFLASVNFVNSQNYIPIPLENTFWRIYEGGGEPGCICNREIVCQTAGDSLFNNLNYTKINFYGSNTCGCMGFIGLQNNVLIRQNVQDRKVYIIEKDSLTEKILYDFTQIAGDTLKSILAKNNVNQPMIGIIQNIDSILINGIYHRRINILNNSFQIIEGVGSTSGFLGILFPFEWTTTLTCMSNNIETLYPNNTINCSSNLSLSKFSKTKLTLSPNPSSKTISLSLENSLETQSIKIYSYLGQEIKVLDFEKNADIDVSDLVNGIYFMELILTNGNSSREKFVKL